MIELPAACHGRLLVQVNTVTVVDQDNYGSVTVYSQF